MSSCSEFPFLVKQALIFRTLNELQGVPISCLYTCCIAKVSLALQQGCTISRNEQSKMPDPALIKLWRSFYLDLNFLTPIAMQQLPVLGGLPQCEYHILECVWLQRITWEKSLSSCSALKGLLQFHLPSPLLPCLLTPAREYNKVQIEAGHFQRRKSPGVVIEMLLPASMAHIS